MRGGGERVAKNLVEKNIQSERLKHSLSLEASSLRSSTRTQQLYGPELLSC